MYGPIHLTTNNSCNVKEREVTKEKQDIFYTSRLSSVVCFFLWLCQRWVSECKWTAMFGILVI